MTTPLHIDVTVTSRQASGGRRHPSEW